MAENNVSAVVGGAEKNRQVGITSDCSNCLKGIFAICVLIHHLYQHSGLLHQTVIGICLQALGYLSVACFFFLSGYGLYASYMSKGKPYINSFLKRKIAPFYCLILLFTVIYLVKGLLLGQTFSIEILLKSLTFGGTIIVNGWYLQVQLLLYLFFFATFRMVKDRRLCITLVFGECLLFCICMSVLGYPSTWYEGVFAFPVGMFWREKDHRTVTENRKKSFYIIAWMVEFSLVCISFAGSYLVKNLIFALILKMVSAVCFAVFVATAIHLIKVENPVTRLLGKYSTEIYLIQGLFLTLFHSGIINLANPYLYVLLVTVSVFAAAVALHPITRKIYSIAREH